MRKLNVTDGQTDGRTDGGALQYLPSRAFGAAGDNKGIEDIMDIDCNCPSLLPVFGETTSHLTSKLNVMDGRTDGRTDGFLIFFLMLKIA